MRADELRKCGYPSVGRWWRYGVGGQAPLGAPRRYL